MQSSPEAFSRFVDRQCRSPVPRLDKEKLVSAGLFVPTDTYREVAKTENSNSLRSSLDAVVPMGRPSADQRVSDISGSRSVSRSRRTVGPFSSDGDKPAISDRRSRWMPGRSGAMYVASLAVGLEGQLHADRHVGKSPERPVGTEGPIPIAAKYEGYDPKNPRGG